MTLWNPLTRLLCLAAALLAGTAVQAQKLDGPLKLVVGYAPGGASDRAARMLGQGLQSRYGINVVVENKPGAGGRLAAQQMKLHRPDEHVLMLGNPAVMTVAPIVFKDNNYDADADFVPVSEIMKYEFAVVVGPQVPVREVSHLIAWLKANPEKAFFGVPATGSLPHFFALMLADRASIKGEIVGYKGSSPLANALLGGEIPVAVDTLDAVLPLHQAGRVKILAVSGRSRSVFAKDIPTLKEQNIDLVADGWNTVFAPTTMSAERVAAYAKAIQTVMADPAVKKQFLAANAEPISSSQQQTQSMLKAYNAQWQPAVKRSGYQQ